MLVNFNGKVIPDTELGFNLLYRATMFADGLFESIYAENQNIYFLDEHLSRLNAGMDVFELQMEKSMSSDNWLENICLIAKEYKQYTFLRIRILVWRKGQGTYNTSNETKANFLIFCEEAEEFAVKEIKTVGVSSKVKVINSWFGDNKTINALNYVGASIEKSNNNLDEIFLCNQAGSIIEASSSNIICVKNNLAFIPKIGSGQVKGIMNDFVISYLNSQKIRIMEREISEDDISNSDLILFCNSFFIKFLQNKDSSELVAKIKNIKTELPKQLLLL